SAAIVSVARLRRLGAAGRPGLAPRLAPPRRLWRRARALSLVGLRRLLVAVVPVVGDVEAGPLEEQPRARGEPALGLRAAVRALRHRLFGHSLELLEVGAAGRAAILVSGHDQLRG